MTEDERKGYRVLFDVTKRYIQNSEAFEAELSKLPAGTARNGLLGSAQKHLEKLRAEADELEKLGWENGNA